MDEAISLDLNGKLTLRAQLVRGVVVAARTGCADTVRTGQFLKIVDERGKQAGDFRAFNAAPFLGSVRTIPQPISLFINVGVFSDGRVETGDNPSQPGACVVCKAWVDGIVALSACPQEFHPVADWYPTDLHVGIYEAA
jgi:uncharacterized protein YcgI (DUF1989 family)